MMSFKKIVAMGMVAVTALSVSAVSFSKAPSAVVYAAEETKETKTADFAKYGGSYIDYSTIEITDFKGSYVYVSVYADNDTTFTKPKATYVYTGEQVASNKISTTNFKYTAKKGCKIKVYSEALDPSEVNTLVIPAQSDKMKIKFVSATADKIVDAFEITCGATKITADNASKYNFELSIGTVDQLELLYVTGGTVYGRWTDENKTASPEAKVKVPAAAKAPKVTVDYVNATVKLPKGVEYEIYVAKEDAVVGSAVATGAALDKAAALEISEVVDKVAKSSTSAAIVAKVAAKDKKPASAPCITVVEQLKETTVSATEITSKSAATVKVDGTEIAEVKVVVDTKGKENVTVVAKQTIQYTLDSKKWYTLKAGASKVVVPGETSGVRVRLAGDKKTETLPSATSPVILKK